MPALPVPTRSIGPRILLQMAGRVALVIVLASVIGYWHVYRSVEESTLDSLGKYVRERGERESQPFLTAQSNLAILASAWRAELARPIPETTAAEFDALFARSGDGAFRRRPQGRDLRNEPSSFLAAYAPLDADSRRRLVASWQLTAAFGRAWREQLLTVALGSLDGLFSIFWPEVDWPRGVPADLRPGDLPWVANAAPATNPSRDPVWTGVSYDALAGRWLTTCVVPIDEMGVFRHYASAAVALDAILARTAGSRLEGTYNTIFRADGRLISHPDHLDRIKESRGEYNLTGSGDAHLEALFRAVTQADGSGVAELGEFDEYLGVARIEGPGWYFVTVFPKRLISATAHQAARTFLWLGSLSLALELLILSAIIRRQIALPMRELAVNAARIRDGDRSVRCALAREDELGQLGAALDGVAEAIRSQEQGLLADNRDLEAKVAERTLALAGQNRALQGEIARRVETERALSIAEQRFSKAFRSSPFIMTISELQSGCFLEVNVACMNLLGLSREALVGRRATDFLLWHRREDRVELLEALAREGSVRHRRVTVQGRDGARHILELGAEVLDVAGTPLLLLVGQDISEAVALQEALRRSRDQLEARVAERTRVLEETSQRLEEEVETRRRLEQHLLEISEQERTRIGRELHDDLGQLLTGAAYLAGALAAQVAPVDPEAGRQAGEIKRITQEAIKRTRYLSRGLIPFSTTHQGLAHGLEQLAEDIGNFSPIHCECRLHGDVAVDDPATATHLYRIAQEALNNAIKHSGARRLRLELEGDDNGVRLTIGDDGVGFVRDTQRPAGGLGLMTMEFRAQLIGATLTVESGAECGTRITVLLPRMAVRASA